MSKRVSKTKMVKDLAAATGISQSRVELFLSALADMAYREAVNGFVIPGICKLKVVRRKESQRRNPITKQRLLMKAHDVLKIVPLKKAKLAVAPPPPDMIQFLPDEPAPLVAAAPAASAPDSKPVSAAAPDALPALGNIVFACPQCGGTVMAEAAQKGLTGVCPVCGATIVIPAQEQAGSGGEGDVAAAAQTPPTEFVLFVCNTCRQEIEAPREMIGMEVNCPACGSSLSVPSLKAKQAEAAVPGKSPDRRSMTIRMDLSDIEM